MDTMEGEEQEWIEAPSGWGDNEEGDHRDNDQNDMIDIFGSTDTSERFTYEIKLDNKTVKTIRLEGYKLDSDETDHSTGVTLWQASPRLAKYLQSHTEICKGKTVLEVGAGLGLCGITAYYAGAKNIVMTDGDTKTLKGMRSNVQQNCSAVDDDRIVCKQLLWGSPHMEKFLKEHEEFDVILAADVIYTRDAIEPLMDTVACLIKKKDGVFILSRYTKWHGIDDEVVIDIAKQRCLHCTRPSEGIFIFRWKEA